MQAATSSATFTTGDGRHGLVRPATREDATPCLAIVREATMMRPRTIMTVTEELWGVREWRKRMLSLGDSGIALIAEVEGKVVGLLGANRGDRTAVRHVAELGITVAEAYRGIGAGRALMRAFEEWSRSLGIERLVLSVYDGNEAAEGLYRSMGYEVEGRERRAVKFPEGYRDVVKMAKLL